MLGKLMVSRKSSLFFIIAAFQKKYERNTWIFDGKTGPH